MKKNRRKQTSHPAQSDSRRKTVRFLPDVTFRSNRSLVIGPRIKGDLWYNRGSLARIKIENLKDLALDSEVETGKSLGTGETCTRGLDTFAGMETRKQKMKLINSSVIIEQRRQKDEGLHDSTKIADIYSEKSKLSKKQAHKVAIRDKADAEEGKTKRSQIHTLVLKASRIGKALPRMKTVSP